MLPSDFQFPDSSPDPPPYRSGVIIEHMPVSQTYFSMGIRVHPYTHPYRYRLHVLNNILGGGISSRLFRRIREERGLVYEIDSEYHAYRDDGILVVEGSTSPEYLMQVLALTLIEFWKLISGDDPPDEEELWKAKMHIRGQLMISAENTNTRMSRLATQELYFGQHILAEEILKEIEAVNAANLQALANESLTDALRRVTIAVAGPAAANDYSVSLIENLLAELR
jgi:predicted Zn-dependent peptidase